MSNQQQRKLVVGLFGFGVVGEGVYKVLQQTTSLNASIKKICIKNPDKPRNAPEELFTTDAALLLDDDEINVIIELIDDAEAAFTIVSSSLAAGKAVVSANKKMIAEHLEELLILQDKYETPLLYEAAACASIPVIRNLEEYYDNDLLQSIKGIVNGSTNYILTKVLDEGVDYATALLQAQIEGFAESDPTLDVEGTDAANKLTLLLAHAYGIVTEPGSLTYCGIQNLTNEDAVYAREKGYQVKLIAQATKLKDGQVAAFVLPQFVDRYSELHNVKNEYNGVVIESSLADNQFFYGKGAGSFPTASAVLSDLSALRYNYRYEYRKLQQQSALTLSDDFYLRVYVSFNKLFQVPQEVLEQITEWSSNESRCYVTGTIHHSSLQQSDWWRKPGTSLIVLPEVFDERVRTKEHTQWREYEPAAL